MYEKLSGIVLHVLRYSDKNSIVHILTDKCGRMAFML
ncbi:MAG: recombination protein O N-terminal domain-containing protein, partial [Muribaculaceae bacterium]|nr:recombination protein O N-terminal domain-containing protein [Muribaculaceae bacterium]